MMTNDWIEYIPWVYISIQVSIALTVSIMGAKYVKNEYKQQKNKMQQIEMEINIQPKTKDVNENKQSEESMEIEKESRHEADKNMNSRIASEEFIVIGRDDESKKKKRKIWRIWKK